MAQTLFERYANVSVFTEAEDTTSSFDTIFLFNQNNELMNIVYVWNGGCCQRPSVQQYQPNKGVFHLVRGYQFESDLGKTARAILCDRNLEKFSSDDYTNSSEIFDRDELTRQRAEAVPFTEC